MNRLTANISLYFITFFAAVQYAFLANVPDTVSTFAFLSVTNLIGFLILLCVFFGELSRLDKKQVTQSIVLSLELFGFNVFLMLGSRGTSATVVACVLSAYFAFIVLISFLVFHKAPEKNKLTGVLVMLVGVLFMMEINLRGLMDRKILWLVIADVFFAVYLLTAEKYAVSSNPSVLAMGQTFFSFLITALFWLGESLLLKKPLYLPSEPSFWGSVFFISFFIRGLYGIVQIYAQRYTSPLNVSLIFSTEIIMTMLVSPFLTRLLGTEPDRITPLRVIGALLMMAGILISDSGVTESLKRRLKHEKKQS